MITQEENSNLFTGTQDEQPQDKTNDEGDTNTLEYWQAKFKNSSKEVQEHLLPKIKELEAKLAEVQKNSVSKEDSEILSKLKSTFISKPEKEVYSKDDVELLAKMIKDPSVSKVIYDTIKPQYSKETEEALKDQQEIAELKNKYSGNDGLPVYDENKINEYRKGKGITREEAYYLLNRAEIDNAKISKTISKHSYRTVTSGASAKDPKTFDEKVLEALHSGN